jgi:hypothetical protein
MSGFEEGGRPLFVDQRGTVDIEGSIRQTTPTGYANPLIASASNSIGATAFSSAVSVASTLTLSSTTAATGAITMTPASTTGTDQILGGLATSASSSTAAIPVKTSPALTLTGTAWNTTPTAATKTQAINNYVLPYSGSTTSGRLVWRNSLVNAVADTRELMSLDMTTGGLSVLGSTYGSETLTNGALTSGTSWSRTGDFALASNAATFTHSTGTGTLTQALGALATVPVGNRWYKFVYTISAVTAGVDLFITTSFADRQIHLTSSVAGTYTLYFKSAATPSDFVIQGTSTAGAATIDTLSLTEVQSGDIMASGLFTGGGSSGIKIDSMGDVGIGITNPTAYLHLKAGTATAGTAPIKLTAGVNNTVPEAGTIEFDGSNYYFVI